jgi:hypothetical protein
MTTQGKPKIPEDLQPRMKTLQGYKERMDDPTRHPDTVSPILKMLVNDGIALIERIARAEARVAELEAQVERLSAPVSDEEWDYRHVGPFTHGCVSRSQVNVIIAARAAEPSKEGKYEQL